MLMTILFPFRGAYRKLALSKYWWYRLSIALYCLVLLFLIAPSSLSRLSSDMSDHENRIKDIDNAYMRLEFSSSGNSPDWTDRNRQLDQRYKVLLDQANAGYSKRLWGDVGFVCGAIFMVSYLLQIAYRILIYVIYGDRASSNA